MRRPRLERLLRGEPRFVTIVAPAGYGKTILAEAYAASFPTRATVDLARVESPRALAIALVEAVREGSGAEGYAEQLLFALAAHDDLPAHLWDRVLVAWHMSERPAAVVFENAERMRADVCPIFAGVLEGRPASRTCIVCSRRPIELRSAFIASPAETMRVRAEDLALSDDEFREMFDGIAVSPAVLARAADVARGWPLVSVLLRRLAVEGRLESVLDRAAGSRDFDDLCAYIQHEVLAGLDRTARSVLEFCTSVPDATVDDVRSCRGAEALGALVDVASTTGIARITGSRIEVHPMAAAALAANDASSHDTDLVDAAHAALRRGEAESAAVRLSRAGRHDEAAAVLSDLLEGGASAAVAALARTLEPDVFERFPRLYAVALVMRRHDVPPERTLLDAARYREAAREHGDEIARIVSSIVEAHLLFHNGMIDEARFRLDETSDFAASLHGGGVVQRVRAQIASRFVDSMRAGLIAHRGDFDEAERLLKRARFAIGQFPAVALAAALDGWTHIAYARADIRLLRTHLARARETIVRAGLDGLLLDLDTHEAFGAWLLGDDALFTTAIARVDARARAYGTQAFDHLLGCAGAREPSEPTGLEPLRRLIFAHLIAAARASDEAGCEHARKAMLFAGEAGSAFYRALAALALRERGSLDEPTTCERFSLHPALEASFLARMRGAIVERRRLTQLALLDEPVRCDGTIVELTPRERDLLIALALARRELSSAQLAEQLGDGGEPLSLAGVHTLVHRVKRRLAPAEIIARSNRGYAIASDVRADLFEIAELVDRLPAHLDDVLRARLNAVHEMLCREITRMHGGAAFAGFERFVRSSAARVAQTLGEDALERGDAAAALSVAKRMRAAEPCDELACELTVRAHLLNGDRSSAEACYNDYATQLRLELDCEPAPHLRNLLA